MSRWKRPLVAVLAVAALGGGLGGVPASPATAEESEVGAEPATAQPPAYVLPSIPPTCTALQRQAGDVASCVIPRRGEPYDHGWPAPPFPWWTAPSGPAPTTSPPASTTVATSPPAMPTPTVPPVTTAPGSPAPSPGADGTGPDRRSTGLPTGWTWTWAFNGSPALAAWDTLMVARTVPRAGGGTMTVRGPEPAIDLFAGFLGDLAAGGYRIREWGSYAFRCESTSARRDCAGLTPAQLSLHSYGLAIDVNWTANPEQTLTGANGASACSVAMRTDVPRWVVDAAQRWGLYWLGYGTGRCVTPTSAVDRVYRDPMHFEFNGSPDDARAVLARLRGDAPPLRPRAGLVTAAGPVSVLGGEVVKLDGPARGQTGARITAAAQTASGAGAWTADATGRVYVTGDAEHFGDLRSLRLNQPINGMAPTPTGKGYWLVASDGGIFAFGDAAFYGSTGGMRLNRPINGMAPTPAGTGYWLFASDGGIFAFGDAPFYGSLPGVPAAAGRTAIGMVPTPSAGGYWTLTDDQQVWAFGDAPGRRT